MRRWALRLLSAAVCAALALVAATTASSRTAAVEYPNAMTGPLKGD